MEEIELSYCGIKDGAKFKVPVGTQRFQMPDPAIRPETFSNSIMPTDIEIIKFIRRPHSNIFVLEK